MTDVDAHGWVLLIDPAAVPPVTPLTLSTPTKASLFPIMLWRCLAGSEHGITQPRPHDLRWVVRAAGLKPRLKASTEQVQHIVIRSEGHGSLGRPARVRRASRRASLSCLRPPRHRTL